MKSTMTAIGAALATTAFLAAPALAQRTYGGQPAAPQPTTEPQQQQQQAQQQPAAPAQNPNAIQTHTPKISKDASKTIGELQKAVESKDPAAISAAVAAAQAAAKTPEDRYVIAILQLKAAAGANDQAGVASAIEAMLASGAVTEEEKYSLYYNLAKTYDALKQAGRAAHYYDLALKQNPNSVDSIAGLAEAKVAQGQPGEALALLQKGIALQSAQGKPSEVWLKRALQIAYKAKLPQAAALSREWVKAYPTKEAWQNSLAIYQNLAQLDDLGTLDLLRLKAAAGVLTAADVFKYGEVAVRRGYPGEAKAVLDAAFAANLADKNDMGFRQLYDLASQRAKGDRAGLPSAPPAGATARHTLNLGDAYFGYGDYAKALEFYRAALGREGADANLINLHIGMALARQGDSAGATAALKSVAGEYAELAQYWMLYAATRG